MFNTLKGFDLTALNKSLVHITTKVEQNRLIADKAVESIKRSNGQIPAAVTNKPYKKHKAPKALN